MKAIEVVQEFFKLAPKGDETNTVDTCKAGDPQAEVQKVAVTMFPTPQVITQARDWGAQLLIVHEPTYYNHMDVHSDEKIENEKRKLIEESGITIYRYHDHAHATVPDVIAAGEFRQMELKGEVEYTDVCDLVRFHLDEPLSPRELAKRMEQKCNVKHPRICGAVDTPCHVVSGMFGAPGGLFDELKSEKSEIVIVGETCEWCICEYVRDAAQLGHKKALILLGHVGSERDGMKYAADLLQEMLPALEVKYFECGEVYTYTDA